ncbi:MAG: uracil phosphoribosyltransferase [Planctomycetales bacterium]|nr:uracil phosphoribosyltransferase [Planctomycetales bacterium]
MSHVVEVRHPLVQHHLARLRDKSTPPVEFRTLIQRLTELLVYEATQDLKLGDVEVVTPLTTMTGQRLSQQIGLVPILRAGLGMVDPVLNLIPSAEVWHLGLYRDEATALPVHYYSKLPTTNPVDVGMVLDPMLATGGSATLALEALQAWGVPRLKLLSIIASQDGIRAVTSKLPDTQIYVCAIDPELNSHKYIVPGLGDAGDRTFNTLRG